MISGEIRSLLEVITQLDLADVQRARTMEHAHASIPPRS